VPLEGVVHALREMHRVLVAGGLLVDTQPVSPRPPVEADGRRLGTLDMRHWRATIDAVDDRVHRVIAEGLFTMEQERMLVVTETFDNGPECVETVSNWQGDEHLAPARTHGRGRGATPDRRAGRTSANPARAVAVG
jgi:hypothetical protein